MKILIVEDDKHLNKAICEMLKNIATTTPIYDGEDAMYAFEKNAEEFTLYPVAGSKEITAISDSFGHMVVQVQELMDKVRKEEITLRKTELNALQAQINPHFLL